jgi:MraZ protein
MFLGTYLVRVTSGKRTSIPSVFRETLGKDLIIAKWYEECLVLVGRGTLNSLLTRITGGKNLIIEPIRKTEHFIYASSFETEADEQGRIVIPDRLFSYAKLGESVYFIGVGDRVEIWNQEIWEQREKEVAAEAAGYIEDLANRNDK